MLESMWKKTNPQSEKEAKHTTVHSFCFASDKKNTVKPF